MIHGVQVHPLKVISDERGQVLHMLRNDAPYFREFGEIYFSLVYPGVIKGWRLHQEMTQHYTVPIGTIRLALYDDRPSSPTYKELTELLLGESNYVLLIIPPKVWSGFKGLGDKPALIANCTTLPHSSEEIVRLDPFSDTIPYNWNEQ